MKNLKKILLTGTITAIALFAMTITTNAATVKVTGDTLNIRKEPSTDAKVVAMISKGVECELIEEQGDWYKIKYKNYTGYISKQYAQLVEDNSKTDNNDSKDNNQINNNTTNTNNQTDNTQSDNNTTNTTGDANSKQEDNSQNTVTVLYKKLNQNTDVRILPLIYASKIDNLKKDAEVLILSETSGWSYVQTDEISGWVRTDSLGEAKNVTTGGSPSTGNNSGDNNSTTTEKTAYINEEYVNMRKGAGTSHKIVKVLTLNAQVTITGEENGWYQVKSGNDTGYISKEFVSDTKKVTSRSLSRTETKTNETEEKTSEKSEDTNEEGNKTDTSKNETDNTSKNESTNNNTSKNETNSNTANVTKATDIVAYAKKYLGHKYVYGGNGSNGTFDCSGFTMYVYKHFGISLPHGATSQYKSGKGTKITKQSSLEVGDIVFLTDYQTGVGIGHCGIYLGNGEFIHASTTTYTVTISSLNTMYKGRFYAGLRLI